MYAQILQIRLSDQRSHSVGHAADTELQAGAVGDLLHDQFRHRLIHFRGSSASAQFSDGRVISLHDVVHLGDMNALLKSSEAAGHVLVDLHDNLLGAFADCHHMGCAGSEVEISVLIHGRHLHHSHTAGSNIVPIVPGQLRIPDRAVVCASPVYQLALDAAHMPGIPAEVLSRVLPLKDCQGLYQNAAPQLYVRQLIGALCQRLIQRVRCGHAPSEIHPVPRADFPYRLIGGYQFLLVFLRKIHFRNPPVFLFLSRPPKYPCPRILASEIPVRERLSKNCHSLILACYAAFYNHFHRDFSGTIYLIYCNNIFHIVK